MPYNKPSCSQERLRILMEHFQLNQTELSKRTGVGRSAIGNYLSGLREPKQDALYMLSNPFNINPVWLMGFDVPMFNSTDDEINEAFGAIVVHDDAKRVMEAYIQADDMTKEMVKRLLKI